MYRKNVRLLSLFNFLVGFSLFAPLAIIYYARVSGSYALAASIFGLAMLASAIFEVPTGIWSDKVGRKKTIILGSWARLLSFIFYAVGLSYWWLVAGAIFEGLSRAFYSGNNNALLYDTLDDEGLVNEYDHYLGKTSSTEQLALGISAILGSLIASRSFTWLLWLSVISQLVLVFVSYAFHEPRSRKVNTNIYAHVQDAVKLFGSNRQLRLLSIASILSFSTGELIFQFRAAFFSTLWPIWALGIPSVISNFLASLSFYFSGRVLKKISAIKMVLLRSAYGKISYLTGLIFPTVFSPVLLSTVSLLYGAGEVAENTIMQQHFTDSQRSTMSSLNSLFGSIGFAGMSLVLGNLADLLGPRLAMIALMVLSIPVTFIYMVLFRDTKVQKI